MNSEAPTRRHELDPRNPLDAAAGFVQIRYLRRASCARVERAPFVPVALGNLMRVHLVSTLLSLVSAVACAAADGDDSEPAALGPTTTAPGASAGGAPSQGAVGAGEATVGVPDGAAGAGATSGGAVSGGGTASSGQPAPSMPNPAATPSGSETGTDTQSATGTQDATGMGEPPPATDGTGVNDDTTPPGDGVGNGEPPSFVYPAPVNPWRPSQACMDRAAEVLAGMTQRQKAGQMVQGDTDDITPADVASYQFGSAFSGGNADPATDNSPQAWRDHVAAYETQAAGFGIPLIYGVDAVHGHNNVSDAVIFPHNIGLGATRNLDLVEQVGRITAREMRGTTTDWTFAPAISPAQDERWGRTFESYSEDPGLTAELAVALVQGLQGESLDGPESVLACAKHFAGDGATQQGVDQGNAVLDDAEFRRLGVEVYQPLINAGVGNIMVSYSSLNGVKMTANRVWLTDVLKNEMGFAGFLSSDWAATAQLDGPPEVQVATAINAGLDMLMEPYAAREIVGILEAAPSASGEAHIPQARIDDAVTRILAIKCEMGMFEPAYDPGGDAALFAEIGSEAHREVARQAVRESAVLLENSGALPLTPGARIHVAGSGADSVQRQCGGWTVNWQGLGIVNAGEIPGVTSGTTILTGIQNATGAENVSFSQDGGGIPADAEAVVVVLSEAPYAEGVGDATDLDLALQTPDVPVLQAARNSGVPVVAVILSGRPLIIEPHLDLADAWLAAWLPGTEANALADVLFGQWAPSGQLGHSWPRTMDQVPINVGDPDYESDPPLYSFGHGLTF